MADPDFVPGQRWVSNTESELGLGIVVENENRRVTVSFPAAGERRVYASDNAPLSRVIYNIGETIKSDEGLEIEIQERHDNNGCVIYGGVDAHEQPQIIAELDLDSFVQFSRPLDRLFAGQIDKNQSFLLRTESLVQQHRHAQSPANGLLGPRVQLLPHQFYIASQVASRYRPRVLLADEVGLGKTIEAGLILHHQLFSGRASRVLIVVPDNLIHQWLVEMLRRFNLRFTILDEQTCVAIESPEESSETDDDLSLLPDTDEVDNPFESAQLVLIGTSLLVDQPERQAQALAATWDLLIVDEAHHLSWSETESSPAYLAVEALAQAAAGLILITATPEQLGIEGHFARLRLLDPDRYHSLGDFKDEEENYRPIADLVSELASPDMAERFAAAEPLHAQLRQYLSDREIADIAEAAAPARERLLRQAIRNLLDRHGTGRVLYRNSRETVHGFPARHLHPHPLPAPPSYLDGLEEATIANRLKPESLLGDGWLSLDPRVAWLEQWLSDNRATKTLLICAEATTAIELEEHLRVRRGVRCAVFHEGMGLVARDRAAAYFADEHDSAELLVCSEIGSEGRNFQFAHHLIVFDIPLNPDLLEQRIGRLDRIGQRNDVEIHIPCYEGEASDVLMRWYHEGLGAIEQVFAAGRLLFDQFETKLYDSLLQPSTTSARDTLITETREQAQITRERLRQGRNRLLELNSFDESAATTVIDNLNEATRKLELANFMDGMFDFFGVDQQVHGPLSVVVHPGDHMLCHNFPGLPEGGITGTFDRTEALQHEDMHFLTWEHPMVIGAMDMMLSGEFGNATLCALKAPFLKPGTLLLEAVFVVSCPAPRYLQLARYIPQATIRVVVDRTARDLTEILTPERLNAIVESIKKHVAHEVAKHARSEITSMADAATLIANKQLAPIVEAALDAAAAEQKNELARMRALATVNPNIRVEEINYRKDTAIELLSYLENTQLRLDAVRVGLAT